MIDLPSVRLEGLVAGAACSGLGAPPLLVSVGDTNQDGIPDVQTKFSVRDARIERGDDQACVTGRFRAVPGRFPDATFETRDHLNVK
jgi:hypothetical protein